MVRTFSYGAIQGSSNFSFNSSALRQFCRENLTGYKRPKLIEFRDSLPKSNVGKILRRELRDEKKATA